MSDSLGRVAALWRYPVKSMRGEMLPTLAIDARGVVGDRALALRDGEGKLGSGKTNKRFRRIQGLLDFVAATRDGAIVIRFPDGREIAADDPAIDRALSDACGVEVTLAREAEVAHRDAAPVHLLSEASLAWLRSRLPGVAIDARRFRPNIVIAADGAGSIEQGWIDRMIAVGDDLVIKIARPTVRCVMTTLPQAELGAAPAILRTLTSDSAASLGIYAEVLRAGTVRVGEALRFA
jgi:uncharacterized protein YcbX